MRSGPTLTAAPTMASSFASALRLRSFIRLIKFRYHLSYATVIFGAFIYQGMPPGDVIPRLALLYLLFNVLLYGGIYTLNDLADLESDRRHPSKSRRPIACGDVSEQAAAAVALVMILAALAGAGWMGGVALAWIFAGFLGINACYSCLARNVPLLDLAFNSLTHPLRFAMGAWLAGHAARPGHLAVIFLFAVGVASLRRAVEKSNPGSTARRTLRSYSPAHLNAVRWIAFAIIGAAVVQDRLASWPFFAAVVPAYLLTTIGLPLWARGRRLLTRYWTT